MAAVSSAILGGIGLATSAIQAIDGANRAKSAQNKLNNYERQELNNAYENVQISTMGSDLLREENARTSSSLTNAAQMGGARTIIGGIPKIVSSTNSINQEAAKMIDDQVQKREYAIAQDETNIRGITEQRDIANIDALSSQVDAGRQDMWAGINSGLTSAAYMGRGFAGGGESKPNNSFNPPAQNFSENINYTPSSPYFNTPMSSPGKAYSFTNNGFNPNTQNFADSIEYTPKYIF